ncbi:PEGA domain-containing protein [Patescibacteria group bacterium]
MIKNLINKTRKNKRLIIDVLVWTIIIIGFVIVASFLIFKASGYAYNIKTGKIEKTGLLYIRTNPRSADIFLEKEYQGSRTPLRISYLLPGKYSLEIKKDGYKTINKTITIYEGLATKVDGSLLVLNEPDFQEIGPKNIIDFKINSKNSAFILHGDKELNISTLNIKDNKLQNTRKIINLSMESKIISTVNSDYLIIFSNKNYYLINWKTGAFINLNEKLSVNNITQLEVDKNIIIVLSDDKLLSHNTTNSKTTTITNNISTFCLNSYIYAIQKIEEKNQLIRINSNNKINVIEESLNIASPTKIKVSKDKQFSILDKSKNLYIYYNNDLKLLNKQILDFNWTDDRNWLEFGEKLALTYYTNNELWIYQKNNKDIFNQLHENYILRRLSYTISDLNFFLNQYNVFYNSNNELTLSDLTGHAIKIIKVDSNTKYEFTEQYLELLLLKDGILKSALVR